MYNSSFLLLKFYTSVSVKHLCCQLSNFLYFSPTSSPLPKANLSVTLDFSNIIFYIQISFNRIYLKSLSVLIFLIDIHLSVERFSSKYCGISSEVIFLSGFLIISFQCFSQGSWLQATVINEWTEAENKGLKWYFKVHKLDGKGREPGLHAGRDQGG